MWFYLKSRESGAVACLSAKDERDALERWLKWTRPPGRCTVEVDAGDRRYSHCYRVNVAEGKTRVERLK